MTRTPLTVYLDIETVPCTGPLLAHALARAANKAPPKNYKDEAKIAAWRESSVASAHASLSLSSSFAAIACIGVRVSGGAPHCFGSWGIGEGAMLDEFTSFAATLVRDHAVRWAGHSLNRFDFPIIRTRLIHHGHAQAHRLFAFSRWDHERVLDLADDWWFPNGGQCASLATMAAIVGVDQPEGSGADVGGQWARGEYDLIERHCLSDLRVTEQVCNALGES